MEERKKCYYSIRCRNKKGKIECRMLPQPEKVKQIGPCTKHKDNEVVYRCKGCNCIIGSMLNKSTNIVINVNLTTTCYLIQRHPLLDSF